MTVRADQAVDVQVLQTAASIESVLVSTYDTILALPSFVGAGTVPFLRNLLATARAQHQDHLTACNELAARLGGKPQTGANAALVQVVARARNGLNDPAQAADLALQLETASADTYQNDVGLIGDLNARRLAGSILAVEAQHAGLLSVVRALLVARTPELVALDPSVLARLPPDAATVAIPDSFVKPDQARPATEGAIK